MEEEDATLRHHEVNKSKSLKDTTVCLRRIDGGRPKIFAYESSFLKSKSKFFAEQLSRANPNPIIEIQCTESNYYHHLDLLNLLHLPATSILNSLKSVKSALGILQVALSLQCGEISHSCIEYLEAVPWEDKEEEEISRIVPGLGPMAVPILARIQPVGPNATKEVFIAAIRFATSGSDDPTQLQQFGNELKTSAQEQIEYMLGEDEDIPLIMVDDQVKLEVKQGLSRIYSSFQKELKLLVLEPDPNPNPTPTSATYEAAEGRILQSLADFQWLCNTILPKVESMKEFVHTWAEISDSILNVVGDQKFNSTLWALKLKLMEVAGKVLEAVAYGSVILPAVNRVELVRKWLPYMRKMKPVLDTVSDEGGGNGCCYPYRVNEDLCQVIEGAIVSLVLALPSNYQAELLADWMDANCQFGFPDLSEAFEIWCYRTKSAKRRLLEGGGSLESSDNCNDGPVSSDLSV